MISFTYPVLNRQMNDCVASKEHAVEVLENVKHNLYLEIVKIDSQLEELKT
jgi:hypothetical protein